MQRVTKRERDIDQDHIETATKYMAGTRLASLFRQTMRRLNSRRFTQALADERYSGSYRALQFRVDLCWAIICMYTVRPIPEQHVRLAENMRLHDWRMRKLEEKAPHIHREMAEFLSQLAAEPEAIALKEDVEAMHKDWVKPAVPRFIVRRNVIRRDFT